MITVVADGLNCYTRYNALSGLRAEAYVKAIVAVEDALSEVNKRIQDTVKAASTVNKKGEAVA